MKESTLDPQTLHLRLVRVDRRSPLAGGDAFVVADFAVMPARQVGLDLTVMLPAAPLAEGDPLPETEGPAEIPLYSSTGTTPLPHYTDLGALTDQGDPRFAHLLSP